MLPVLNHMEADHLKKTKLVFVTRISRADSNTISPTKTALPQSFSFGPPAMGDCGIFGFKLDLDFFILSYEELPFTANYMAA